jgi:predicted PurR-regulated permease PerM
VLSVVLEQIQPLLLDFSRRAAAAVSRNVFKLLACLFAIYFLLRHGLILADQLNRGVRELGGERLVELVEEIRLTVRAVVYGLVMTAIAQALLAAFGFWLADVPYPLLLGSLLLVASFIPFGPPFVWLPAAIAVFARGDIGWGIFLLIWGAGVISMMDNVLRPLFIGQATRMPVLLVFIAVLGGIMSFGMVGLFVGPVVMAVALALWRDWIGRRDDEAPEVSRSSSERDPREDAKLE